MTENYRAPGITSALADLKFSDLPKKEQDRVTRDIGWARESRLNFFKHTMDGIGIALVVITLLVIPTYCTYKSITAGGKRDYCYVYYNGGANYPKIYLKAHVEWRLDDDIVPLLNVYEAPMAAAMANCKLENK